MSNNRNKNLVNFSKTKDSTIGLVQALGVGVYCGLVSGFMWLMEEMSIKPPRILTATLMLILLVFSVAISGLLVFGYPVYLALNNQIKKALVILGYTFLYSIAIILIILLLMLS